VPYYDPSYDDLENNNKRINVYVSTTRDPYVWANYNGTLHFSNLAESYSTAGIWLITCAIALALIPLLVYFKNTGLDEDSNVATEPSMMMDNPMINVKIK
jgi:hypothetical protein